jgi:murein DD-endopeptidase MepM/ murein hydrolase activator NlpD
MCKYNHYAVDLVNTYNHYGNIYAADRGVVIKSGWHPLSGYYINLSHSNGYLTHYYHMSRPGFFPVGVAVEKGEIIGQIGNTGSSTGPHLHFEIWYNGVRRNPCVYLGC